MPAMVRPQNNNGTKIAFKILGVPPNIAYKPTSKEKIQKDRINFEDTRRVR